MTNRRVIARLDVKMDFLIKGVQMEGWRKVGSPAEFAAKYYADGADELAFFDVVASLYERNNLTGIVRTVAEEVFIPITVGGGVRTLEDVRALLSVGADKVTLNTGATQNPELLRQVSETYGSQATVLSLEAKRNPDGKTWEPLTDNGRNHTGRDAIEWAEEAVSLGAGEIMVTSIDRDGTEKGPDIELIRAVSSAVTVPVIACGGIGTAAHVVDAFQEGQADAVATAKALHYGKVSVADIKQAMRAAAIPCRPVPPQMFGAGAAA